MRAEEKEGGKGKERKAESGDGEVVNRAFCSFAKFVVLALAGFHQKGIRHTTGGGHFRYLAFSGEDMSQTWIHMEQHRNGYTAKEERKDIFFLFKIFGAGSLIRVWSLLGRCGCCRNVDGCRHGRMGSGKETESNIKKLGSKRRKRQTECVCV